MTMNPVTRRTIDQSAGGKLRDRNAKESWALLEDLTLYDNESWNDPRDFAKSVKAIALPQDVSSTSDHCLIELENQVQRLIEAHLAPTQPTQLFSLKYLSPASIKELNKNSSALKRVHFVNSIVVLIKENDTEEEDVSSTNPHEHDLKSMMRRKEEAKEQCEEEDEMGTAEEVE
ncbi:hypothetical protein Tco_1547497 [Tanacetum coccineum]